MFRFLLGFLAGFVAGRMLRQPAVDTKMLEERFTDVQKRAEAVLIESRRILEETRQELRAALEASGHSMQVKAERLRTAVTEPEVILRREGEKAPTAGEEIPRPSQVE